jgi:cation transport ATPase
VNVNGSDGYKAREVVEIVKTNYHCEITSLTGDSQGAAHSIAQQVGMHNDYGVVAA